MKVRLALCSISIFGGSVFAQFPTTVPIVTTLQPVFGGSLFHQSSGRSTMDGLIYKLGTGPRGRGAAAFGVRRGKFAWQIGLVNNVEISNESIARDFDNNPLPPSPDARFLGNYRAEIGGGADFLYFSGNEYQSLYVGFGLYYQTTSEIWRSPSTGELYDLGSIGSVRGAFSIGFTGDLGDGNEFGLGYHTMLGWNISYTKRIRSLF